MKTIVWDVDDVLNDLMRTWFERWWRPAHLECVLSYLQFSENPPHKILGIELNEYLKSLDAFRLSYFHLLEPVPDVLQWFHTHGEEFRHVVLTAVPLRTVDVAAAWALKHYGTWVRSFNFVPSLRAGEDLPSYDLTKKDFLVWLNKADILVDDNAVNIQAASELGIEAVLMPRPWNLSKLTLPDTLSKLASLSNY